MMTYAPFEIAVVGNDAQHKARRMQVAYHPTAIFMGGMTEDLPLLKNKLVNGRTLIYVCRNKTCRAPQENIEQAFAELAKYQVQTPQY